MAAKSKPAEPAPSVAADVAPARDGVLDQSGLLHLVGYGTTRAAIELKKSFQRHMGPLKLKAVEFSILVLVDTNPEVNQKQLGRALDVSPPNLAVTLDRMVEQGWVRRERSERDRRAQLVRLTAAGQALATRARKIGLTMEQDALKVLTPAEQALLIELLQRVALQRPRAH
ncbi:MAG: MarR family transcriptional regulator [Burkholderiaceae bacterium]